MEAEGAVPTVDVGIDLLAVHLPADGLIEFPGQAYRLLVDQPLRIALRKEAAEPLSAPYLEGPRRWRLSERLMAAVREGALGRCWASGRSVNPGAPLAPFELDPALSPRVHRQFVRARDLGEFLEGWGYLVVYDGGEQSQERTAVAKEATAERLRWECVSIRFVANDDGDVDSIRVIAAGAQTRAYTYEELGMVDRRTAARRPDESWQLFQLLAMSGGELAHSKIAHRDKSKDAPKAISRLREKLREVITAEGDPIQWRQEIGAYRLTFVFTHPALGADPGSELHRHTQGSIDGDAPEGGACVQEIRELMEESAREQEEEMRNRRALAPYGHGADSDED